MTRSIEILDNGVMKADALANYPDGTTEFGFGTLIGDSFYALDWHWPNADVSEKIVVLPATEAEFAAIWAISAT
ncbi:MAG: hypothetical protein WC729_21380 [Sphingomonas sp.]|uniref:hypothetical protein n=1 Tax=Sphingomonas sp. TaxID=28214 RepID=UPI0035641FB7